MKLERNGVEMNYEYRIQMKDRGVWCMTLFASDNIEEAKKKHSALSKKYPEFPLRIVRRCLDWEVVE